MRSPGASLSSHACARGRWIIEPRYLSVRCGGNLDEPAGLDSPPPGGGCCRHHVEPDSASRPEGGELHDLGGRGMRITTSTAQGDRPMDPIRTRTSTVIVGLMGLCAVLATALWLDARNQAVTVEIEGESLGLLPPPVAMLPTSPTPVAVPQVPVDANDIGQLIPVNRVMRTPHVFRGRYFECWNILQSLPAMHQGPELDARFHPLLVPVRCSADTSGVNSRGPGRATSRGETTLIHVRFDRATAAAIPSVGRNSILLLQGLGAGPTGTPLARFIRVLNNPRGRSPLNHHLPDLMSILVGAQPPSEPMRCLSQGLPRLVGQGRDAPSSEISAQLSCRDARGVSVALRLGFADAVNAQHVLRIVAGTLVRVRVIRASGTQLIGKFVGIEAGAGPAQRSDLRLIQLDPRTWRGRDVRCQSMGVPPPLETVASALDALPAHSESLSNRRAWLVCRQKAAPPVHLNLFLPRGQEPELLRVGRGTEIAVRVLGASGSHVDGVLKGVISHELPVQDRAGDLRRYVLLSGSLQGQRLRCSLLHAVLRPPPSSKRGPKQPAPELATTRVHCVDSHRPQSGQAFQLDFRGADSPQRLAKGTVLDLQFTGVISATPQAKVLGVVSR